MSHRNDKQNKAYEEKILKSLWGGVRKVTEKAASGVITSLVTMTFHDSSNAAYNWNFEVNGDSLGYRDYKGITPVGKRRAARTISNSPEIQNVAISRMRIEQRKLFTHLFQTSFDVTMPKFGNFSVVNSVDDLAEMYAYNAMIAIAAGSGEVARAWDLNIATYGNIYF